MPDVAMPEKVAAPAPVPMKVGRKRPYGRIGESHLRITADAIACLRCKAIAPRPAGATLVAVEHEANCKAIAAAA